MAYNVFVVGLDDVNRARLKAIRGAEQYRSGTSGATPTGGTARCARTTPGSAAR